MKILKQGKIQLEKKAVVTCDSCKTEFEFEMHEGVYHNDLRDGDYVSIACPTCFELVNVSINLFR